MILPADFRQVDGRLGILHSEILHRLGDDLRDGEIAEPLVKRYGLINDFEKMLVDAGVTILKFFLYISKEEQLERFKQRLDDPARNWKISESTTRSGNTGTTISPRSRTRSRSARPSTSRGAMNPRGAR